MSSKKALVTTTNKIVREGIIEMGTKPNVVKEAVTPPIAKNSFDTGNKTDKSQASKYIYMHPESIKMTKVNHWINQGLRKELKQKTN